MYEGGGQKKIEAQHANGKLTARERIDYLLDKDTNRIEIGTFTGDEMYADVGGCPGGGVVVVIGYVSGRQRHSGRQATITAVKAGAWFPVTAKKNLRAIEVIAMENRLPIIYSVDSAGVFLPSSRMRCSPDKEHFGRIFRNNAVMSSNTSVLYRLQPLWAVVLCGWRLPALL